MYTRKDLIEGNVYSIEDIKEYLFENPHAMLLSESISNLLNQHGSAKLIRKEFMWAQKSAIGQYRTLNLLSSQKIELIYAEKIIEEN